MMTDLKKFNFYDDNQEKKMSTKEERFLIFHMSNQEYAIPLLQVREVLGMKATTPIPSSPAHFKGIMNLRGSIFSIIDLRLKLNLGKPKDSQESTVIILDMQPLSIGILVDSINCVIGLEEDQISPAPETEKSMNAEYIRGVAQRENNLILLLNVRKVFNCEDIYTISSQVA
jgi:purine-binding chemotaxis protein CheW